MYKVCIRCYTFNQAQYIEDAMNGFVMQETDFPFVATIVDDASTDKTPQVITSYFDRSFDTEDSSVAFREETEYGTILFARHKTNLNCYFAIVLLKENHHSLRKSKRPYLKRWTDDASYVALCEGDDYWTDPMKLQKQADYMDNHPECSLCVHSCDWLVGEEIQQRGCHWTSPKDLGIEELISVGGWSFATASFMFKSELSNVSPAWRKKARVGDYPLQILCGLHGYVHYLPDNMGVYRFQHEGSWSQLQQQKDVSVSFHKNRIEWMTMLDDATDHKYQKVIYDQLFKSYNSLFNHREIGFGDYVKAVRKSGEKRYGRLMKDFLLRILKKK